jgi:hypothetical protein
MNTKDHLSHEADVETHPTHADLHYLGAAVHDVLTHLKVEGATVRAQSGITPTAAYVPSEHTVLVNPDFVFPDGYEDSYENYTTFGTSMDESVQIARGAVIHEAGHAHYSKFSLADLSKLDRNVGQVIIALEELRIEYNMNYFLGNTKSLANTTYQMDLVHGAHYIARHNIPVGPVSPLDVSTCLALTFGRVDVGVLSFGAAMVYRDAFEVHMDPALIENLRALWLRYMGLTDRDLEGRVEIAKEWCDLLDLPSGDENGMPEPGGACLGDPDEGEGEGDGEGEGEGDGEGEGEGKGRAGSSFGDDIRDAADYAYEVTKTDAAVEHKNREAIARRAALEGASKSREKREAMADRAHKSHGYGESDPKHWGRSLFAPSEAPTSDEAAAMVALARRLDKVSYTDKHKTKVGSLVPPGRLSGRGAVQASAQADRGQIISATPWKSKRRKSVPKTPLTVGIIADVSGSMGSSVRSVSTAAWMLSEAVNRVQGRTSTVLMGEDVYGLVAPGKRFSEIPRYNAYAGHENFTDAYMAIDGSLNLVHGRGARILFCVTDGHFVSSTHNDYAHVAMREAKAAGIQVFWLDYDGYSAYGRYPDYGYGEVLNMAGMTEQEQAAKIGDVVIKAFDKVKAR